MSSLITSHWCSIITTKFLKYKNTANRYWHFLAHYPDCPTLYLHTSFLTSSKVHLLYFAICHANGNDAFLHVTATLIYLAFIQNVFQLWNCICWKGTLRKKLLHKFLCKSYNKPRHDFKYRPQCCRVHPGQVVLHMCVSVTKQLLLLLAKNVRWCFAAGKDNLGRTWPRVIDISGSPPKGSRHREGDEHPPTLSSGAYWTLPFYLYNA